MTLLNFFKSLLCKKNKVVLDRQFTADVKDGVCPLCEKKDDNCDCTILNCHCNISSIECKWPDCVCNICLETPRYCRCKNE